MRLNCRGGLLFIRLQVDGRGRWVTSQCCRGLCCGRLAGAALWRYHRSRPHQEGVRTLGGVTYLINLISFFSLDSILISKGPEICLVCRCHTAPICLFDKYAFFYLHILPFFGIFFLFSYCMCFLFELPSNILISGRINNLPNIKRLRESLLHIL